MAGIDPGLGAALDPVDPDNPPKGGMYVLYTCEDDRFDNDVKGFAADTLQTWTAMYIRALHEVVGLNPPVKPVTAKELSEMLGAVSAGGLILERACENPGMAARRSRQVRDYPELLFPTALSRGAA